MGTGRNCIVEAGTVLCGVDADGRMGLARVWALRRETGLWNDRPDAAAILQMATEHGARSTGFGDIVGRIEPGRRPTSC